MLVGLYGQREQFLNFLLQLCLDLAGVFIRQGTVTRGVGVNLGAIEADGAELGGDRDKGKNCTYPPEAIVFNWRLWRPRCGDKLGFGIQSRKQMIWVTNLRSVGRCRFPCDASGL